ncbi:MAG: integrase [Rhizobiaceae bacterium]
MSVMQSEVFEAFRAMDVPEDKVLKAAAALSKRDDEVSSIKADTLVLKWMLGFVLAFQVGIFVKLFM